jgi:GNAT superfamily N-acetyltransferase
VKGQKLFVRTASTGDQEEIARFYSEQFLAVPSGSSSLVGKLVGRIVAHLTYTTHGDIVMIEHILVARDLRRRRVGRFMISELERLAGSGVTLLRARQESSVTDFLRTIGFRPSAGGILERPISHRGEP